MLFVLMSIVIASVQSGYLICLFVRSQYNLQPIPVEVPSDGLIKDIKDELANNPRFPDCDDYVITLHGEAIPDSVRLSDCGVTSECVLGIIADKANMDELKRAGFNETELEYFRFCLERCGPKTYAVFWAQAANLHFVKRAARNKYQHMCVDGKRWLSNNTCDIYHFLRGFRRITDGDRPIVGAQFVFECRDESESMCVKMAGCTMHCFLPRLILFFRRIIGRDTVPPDCSLCQRRLSVPSPHISIVRTHMLHICKTKSLRYRGVGIICALFSFPVSKTIRNRVMKRCVPIALCAVAVVCEASAKVYLHLGQRCMDHFATSTTYQGVPMRVPRSCWTDYPSHFAM